MNKCYVCFNETKNKSNCLCKSYICNTCLVKELKFRNGKCSICKNDIIIKKSLIQKILDNKFFYFFICSLIIILFLFCLFFLGNIFFCLINNKKINFKLEKFLIFFVYGIFVYICTIITMLILYSITCLCYNLFR